MQDNTPTPPDRLLDTADAVIDVLVASPGMTIDQLTDAAKRPDGSFSDRVFTHTTDQEIIDATRFLARCGIIAMERKKARSSN